jgi:NAD(P)-dependent dehydrogenase (short-subunit alcohol dehydrogenase family)
MRLENKVALITGAASGIGRASALLFAREGAAVVVADVSEEAGAETVDQIHAAGGKASFVRADVSRSDDCKDMIAHAESTHGKLDILFNNAGISHAADDDAEATEEDVWDLTMAINLKGVFLGCKHGLPALRRAGGGSIINTASFVAMMGAATPQLAYTASKMKYLDTEEKRQRRMVHIPLGRFGEAEEIAKAALFLASDESTFTTGATFLVDGGITAAYVTPE